MLPTASFSSRRFFDRSIELLMHAEVVQLKQNESSLHTHVFGLASLNNFMFLSLKGSADV